jgi:hypothetical protein
MDSQRADNLSKETKKRKRNIEEERTSHKKEQLQKTVEVFATAHIFQKIFSPDKMALLSSLIITKSDFWVEKKDQQCGTLCKYFIAGKWTEQGHSCPGID